MPDLTGCFVLFSQWNETSTAVFGLPFLESFVTLLDYDKSTVAFAVNSQAPNGVMVVHKLTGLDIGVIVVGTVLALGAIIGVVLWCRKKSKN